MALDTVRSVVSRRPGWVVGAWLALAACVGILAPNLTRLAAEGQAHMLGPDVDSRRAAEVIARAWPEQSYGSLAVVAVHRPDGLTEPDRAYVRRLEARISGPARPRSALRVLGPSAPAEVAARLSSRDGTLALVAVPLGPTFFSPAAHEAVARLQGVTASPDLLRPAGLSVLWSGDAVMGRDYMAAVQTSLDRAAVTTVVLLLLVLLTVYRSIWLALVPLATIGVSLVISRSVLAWLSLAGWETSPLVELFLVAVLFGSGTDFCLFVSWRFAEHWNPADPAGAMDATLVRAFRALMTSAGTVIMGLLLMGLTRFKLFSTTGPSVALGLAITLAATLTLTPALLVLLARFRPQAFRGMTAEGTRTWDRVGRVAMARPLLSWGLTLFIMAPLAVFGLRTNLVQDLLSELPPSTSSAQAFRLIATKFEPGMMAPLSLVLTSETDLRGSEGLALVDDLSRFLSRQRRLTEVRSATQPLGDPATLARARIASRLGEVNDGFIRIAEGAGALHAGLGEGAAKLRAAVWLETSTGLSFASSAPGGGPPAAASAAAREALGLGLKRASIALLGSGLAPTLGSALTTPRRAEEDARSHAEDDRLKLVDELLHAADSAGKIADGARRAGHELTSILEDPVGRRALNRLLVNAETVRENPELRRSFAAYLTPDGRHARIDLSQADRVFSTGGMDGVETLRRRIAEFLADADGPRVSAAIAGANAECADVRSLTRADQFQSWFIIPAGVLLVLFLALGDPLACLNLVATMLLTYAFALGATQLVFVTWMGAEGLDWKVPYFLFVLLVAVGVDYNIFLMDRLREETRLRGLRAGIVRAIGQTGGLISSAAAITACSFASFLTSPLGSLRQLGFALVVGITVDALLVRPLLVPCGHWLLSRRREPLGVRRTNAFGLRSLPHFAAACNRSGS